MRSTLGAALQFFKTDVDWRVVQRRTPGQTPFTVEGGADFHLHLSGVFPDFRGRARQAVARALLGAAEGISDAYATVILRHEVPGESSRVKRLVERSVSRAIDQGGYRFLVDVADRRVIPCYPPISTNILGVTDRDFLDGITAPTGPDLLRADWQKDAAIPSDRDIQKAVKWVFGQSWDMDLSATSPLRVSIIDKYRFRSYLTGRHLETPTDLARTVAVRATDMLVHGVTRETLEMIAPGCPRPRRGSGIGWISEFRSTLRSKMIQEADATGYEGLRGLLTWAIDDERERLDRWDIRRDHTPDASGSYEVRWDMEAMDYVLV